MAVLTVTKLDDSAGVDAEASFVAAAVGGDLLPNGEGDAFVHVKNAGVGSINVTAAIVNGSRTIEGFGAFSKSSLVVAVPAGEERLIGPFPRGAWNNTSGQVALSYSGVTSVTVRAYRAPRV
jgi:hypothetical protein